MNIGGNSTEYWTLEANREKCYKLIPDYLLILIDLGIHIQPFQKNRYMVTYSAITPYAAPQINLLYSNVFSIYLLYLTHSISETRGSYIRPAENEMHIQ